MEVFQGKAVSLIQGCTHLCKCPSKTKPNESDSYEEVSNEKFHHKAGLYHSVGVRQPKYRVKEYSTSLHQCVMQRAPGAVPAGTWTWDRSLSPCTRRKQLRRDARDTRNILQNKRIPFLPDLGT